MSRRHSRDDTPKREKFDFKKVANLELDWWFVDRYPERYPSTTREDGLSAAMAAIYNIEPSKLVEYARYRAAAMVLQDEAEKIPNAETDWKKIGELLKLSYKSLRDAVNRSP